LTESHESVLVERVDSRSLNAKFRFGRKSGGLRLVEQVCLARQINLNFGFSVGLAKRDIQSLSRG